MKYLRFSLKFVGVFLLILFILLSGQVYSYFQPVTAEGRYVLLRLEDVGPGGSYGTPEGLGKLRTILDYLHQQNIPYHITVVSRWKNYNQQTGWTESGIDSPTPFTQSFVQLLKQAQDHGAILGMHGYSHQYGDKPRSDGQENSGFAFEFHIKGEPDSDTKEYAEEKIEKSLHAFKENGLYPAFWETPHYHSTLQQQQVFRSYMGILYEPNKLQLRSLKDVAYSEEENTWKGNSQGTAYIPAPLKYITSEERLHQIISQLKDYHSLASLYYHPYLEFPFLEPVQQNGHQIIQNGLPVYKYKQGEKSPLHQIINGVKSTHYIFGTIHDIVPFTPANQIQLSDKLMKNTLLTGDMNGDGRDDWVEVVPQLGQVKVTLSNLDWPRNKRSPEPDIWLQNMNFKEKGVFLLTDADNDKQKDLIYLSGNQLTMFKSEGSHFSNQPNIIQIPDEHSTNEQENLSVQWLCYYDNSRKSTIFVKIDSTQNKGQTFEMTNQTLVKKGEVQIPSTLIGNPETSSGEKNQIFLEDCSGDQIEDLLFYNESAKQIWVMTGEKGTFQNPELWYSFKQGDHVNLGDFNGDGKTDLVVEDRSNGHWQVAHSTGSSFQNIPAFFGPWSKASDGMPIISDWDGNGKADIGMYNPHRGLINVALSFQK